MSDPVEEDIIEWVDSGSFESEVTPFAQAHNDFASRLFKLLNRECRNVFFSPFSLSTCLAMLYCGAEGETATEIRDILGYDAANINKEDILSCMQEFMTDLDKNQSGCVLELATSMLVHSSFAVKDDFKTIVESKFKSSISEVNVDEESGEIDRKVKEWVQNKTRMTNELLESFNASDIMVLLSAVYFKASWLQPFDKQATVLQCFYNQDDDAKEVEMMHLKDTLLCLENDEYQVVQLPFRGEEIAMMVLLPTSKVTLETFEDELTPTFIQDMRRDMHKRNIHLELPRFRLEYSKSLKSFLQCTGLEKIFGKTAEFNGISDYEGLSISDIMHKAVIDISEEGSEASAATEATFATTCDAVNTTVVADHPFIFTIYDLRSDMILFLGKIAEL